MIKRIRTVITDTSREPSSRNGNPRYLVATKDGNWRTIQDGQVAFGITNPEYRQGEIILTVDSGQIVGVSTVDGEHCTGRQA